jgi:cytosine permease
VGFFATAGAAGVDFGMNNRDAKDVQLGGLVGVAGATLFTGVLAVLIIAGIYGSGGLEGYGAELNVVGHMKNIFGENTVKIMKILLAIAAFPPACFASFIAANSFKTTLSKVNPFISVGIGTLGSIGLVVSRKAGNAADVFVIIGASFGPICGAMMADYLLAGRKWAGPRAGFNPAGWISWAVGFVVGISGNLPYLCDIYNPCPPVMAFIVGFVLYLILAKIGLQSKTLEMPKAEEA